MNKTWRDITSFVDSRKCLLVITGAGCSTGSGIGDYRDERGDWKKLPPIQYQDFLNFDISRKRYWSRSQVGYPSFRDATPNRAHLALSALEDNSRLSGLITQNVDRLHQKAGHRQVLDLHGRLDQARCLECGLVIPRDEVQVWLDLNNPWLTELDYERRPDGDAAIENVDLSSFVLPSCNYCEGLLKPDVVFFGGSVPKSIVDRSFALVGKSDGVLVVGTSLMAYSSYRLVRRAHQLGLPLASINQGLTRADELFDLQILGDCSKELEVFR